MYTRAPVSMMMLLQSRSIESRVDLRARVVGADMLGSGLPGERSRRIQQLAASGGPNHVLVGCMHIWSYACATAVCDRVRFFFRCSKLRLNHRPEVEAEQRKSNREVQKGGQIGISQIHRSRSKY